MNTTNNPLHKALIIASTKGTKTLNLKPYRLRKKASREMYEILANNPKRYWVATAEEMRNKYPNHFQHMDVADCSPGLRHIWTIDSDVITNPQSCNLYWVAVR